MSGPIRILSFPIREIKKMLHYHLIFNEYKRLEKEVGTLKARMIGLDEVLKENTRLENLLEFKRRLIYESVAANVVGRDPSHWNSSMIIDRGEVDGIRLGQPVVNAFGVLGKIVEVDKHISKVILLTDPQFSIAALIQRPREVGLVTGSLQGVCRLKFIQTDADIRVGDKVITSKLSASFPEGLIVGEIVQVQHNLKSNTLDAIVQPAVSLSQIEEVLVIIK